MLLIKSAICLYRSPHFSKSINLAIFDLEKCTSPLISTYHIGSSVQGTPLLAVKLGFGPTHILIHGTHHAREAITTILILDQINYLARLYQAQASINDISIVDLLNQITFTFVPLVNPDGADLVLNGKSSLSPTFKGQPYLQKRYFPSWKANIHGVDLNENYPTQYPTPNLACAPGAELYPGSSPFSEPETLALKNLTHQALFDGTISYHSSGEEIYWYYNQPNESPDLSIVQKVAKETGYILIPKHTPTTGSGYKDWFIETYHKPSLTIEVSPYVGPRKVPAKNYRSIYYANKNVPILFGHKIHTLIASSS